MRPAPTTAAAREPAPRSRATLIRAASLIQQRVARAIEGRREFSCAWNPAVVDYSRRADLGSCCSALPLHVPSTKLISLAVRTGELPGLCRGTRVGKESGRDRSTFDHICHHGLGCPRDRLRGRGK